MNSRGPTAPKGSEDGEDEEAVATATLPTWPWPPRGAQKTKKTRKSMVPALADLPAWRRELVIALGEVAQHGQRSQDGAGRLMCGGRVGRAAEVARRSPSSVEGARAQLAGASCRSA